MRPHIPYREPIAALATRLITALDAWITPMFDVGIRLYIAHVFLLSGLTKVRDWSSTLALFEHEYQVPLLSPVIAAWLGTTGELLLPVFLALGLAGRFSAAGLFIVNLVAVVSYPELSDLGRQDHLLWGTLLLVTLLHGPGRWALDHWLAARAVSARRGHPLKVRHT